MISILTAQLVVTGLLTLVLLALGGRVAFSATLGGFICFFPNLYLAYKLTAKRSAEPDKTVRILYTAEFGKIIITVALFAAVFATQKWIQPVALLGGFGLVQLTHWLTPVLLAPRINKSRDP